MRIWPGQRARTVAAFSALSIAVATLAVLHDGTKSQDLELNDGGVWVTNLHLPGGRAVAAHLNYPSRTLDSYTEPATDKFDVSQEANSIVLHDERVNGAASIDTTTWQVGASPQLPKGAVASQGGGVVVVADPNQGKVWAVPASSMDEFSPELTPALKDVIGVRAVVGVDETIHTVTPDGELRDLDRAGSGWVATELGSVPTIDESDALSVTAVGGTGVVVDHTAGWVAWPGGSANLADAADLLVQQPGSSADAVVLAGPSTLVRVPLNGAEPEVRDVAANGAAVAPVTVGACTYAAWTRTGQYVRDCTNDSDDVAKVYEDLAKGTVAGLETDLHFRVNRDVVVLNNAANGDVFLVNEDMLLVNDWSSIQAQIEQDDKEKSDEVILSTTTRSKENRPPRPEPDNYGVRAGSSVTLPVLANDTDPDGDVLLASVDDGTTTLGEVEQVRNGRALRITVPDDAEGGDTFEYEASDGRPDGAAPARVQIQVHDSSVNEAPRLIPGRTSELTMVERGSGEHRMLQEYLDPDGDPFWVAGVTYPDGMDGVFRPDGLIKVTDDGTQPPGKREVKVALTDGREQREAILEVRVRPRLPLPPVANADFTKATIDEPVVVSPLTNDTDPNDDNLFVTSVDPDNGVRIEGDVSDGKVTLTGTKVGTQYVEYTVSDGTDRASGVIRVDVGSAETSDAKPVPDNDLAVLPESGETLVDVLSNDTDPLGGVLVLQSVSQGETSGVTAEVVDHESLRIRSTGLGEGTATLTYRVGNRNGSAQGSVTVVQNTSPAAGTPLAFADTATVRSGDIVTVDVLDNDVSPGDRPLHLLPDLVVTEGGDLGTAFVSGDRVRFKADADSGSVRIKYTAADPDENANTGTLDITIQPSSGSNAAPTPEQLTARLVQGGSTEIEVPLEGIDPDGDSVTLLGIDKPPTIGVAMVDAGVITYSSSDALGATGTDTFTYLVEDRFGRQAAGTVRVGIAPRPASDESPVPTADEVAVRPGRLLAVPVTVNDIDPEGEPLALVDGSVQGVDGSTGTKTKVVDGRIQLQTPDKPRVLRYAYDVTDGTTIATGNLSVDVRRDAPLQPPVARDDIVPLADIVGQDQVTVDVLRNDEDPDGAASILTPTTEVPGITPTSKGALVVPLTPKRQVIVYTITDEDGLSGQAVVVVPGTDSDAARRPVVRSDAPLPLQATSGDVLEIPLDEYVAVREGRQVSVPFSESVRPGPGGDTSQRPKKDDATLLFRPLPGFYGLTSISFTVSDALGDSDADAKEATLTLPIEVASDGRTRPSLTLPTITVTPGEAGRELDLRALSEDPDDGDLAKLTFALEGALPDDLSVGLDGSTLTVAAPTDARPGVSRELRISVTDGSTKPVLVDAIVKVVATTKPLMTVRDAVVEDADAGKAERIDLNDYVTNPFADDGDPIRLAGAPRVVGPAGSATARPDGNDAVVVTPGDSFHGTTTVSYVVADATGLPERQVQGLIRLRVRAVPDAPTITTAIATKSKTVEVNWRAGANNGTPIIDYTLSWTGGGGPLTVSGGQTSKTVTVPANDVNYQFTVVARNEVGPSKPSASSRKVRPDDVPGAPPINPPSFGDTTLAVSWGQPVNAGSPIEYYRVEYNGLITRTQGAERALKLENLTNGTPYQVRVQAVNRAEIETNGIRGAGPWSSIVTEHPNGVPAAPVNLQIEADGPDPDPSALVRWDWGSDNGHETTKYEVRNSAGKVVACASVEATACRVDLPPGEDSAFSVRSFNRSGDGIDGWGPWSAPTATARGARPPGAVKNLKAVPTGESGAAKITFSDAERNGAEKVTYHYRVNGGGSGTITNGTVLHGLPDGSNRDVSVWAVSEANGKSSDPGPEQSDGVNAYGPCTVGVRNISDNSDNVTFGWRVYPSGRNCDVTIERNPGGNISDTVGDSGERTLNVGTGRNQQPSLKVTARPVLQGEDTERPSREDSASGRTWGDPGYEVRHNGTCVRAGTVDCEKVELRLFDWRPSGSVYCWAGGVSAPDWYHTFPTDPGGDAGWSGDYDGGTGVLFDSKGNRFANGYNTGEFSCR